MKVIADEQLTGGARRSDSRPGLSLPSPDGVFLTPRVIDQNRMEQLIAAMRELVEQARDESTALQSHVGDVESRTGDAAKLASQLHERLSLGARMLKAFQSQIDRVAQVLDDAADRESRLAEQQAALDERFRSIDSRFEESLKTYERRLMELTDEAAARYQARIGESDPVVRELQSRAQDIAARLDQTGQQANSLEQSISGVMRSHDRLCREVEEATTRAEAVVERSEQARDLLVADLRSAEQDLSEVRETTRSLESRHAALMESCHGRIEEFEQLYESIVEAGETLRADADRQIASATYQVGTRLRQELARTAMVFRSLAEGAERTLATDARDPEPTEVEVLPQAFQTIEHRTVDVIPS